MASQLEVWRCIVMKYELNSFVRILFLMFYCRPYTKLVLMEDIQALRDSSTGEVKETATRFCNRHHVRLVMAAAGFITALVSLAEM